MPLTAVSGGYTVVFPPNFGGQTYAILTSSQALSDATTVAGPAIIESAEVY